MSIEYLYAAPVPESRVGGFLTDRRGLWPVASDRVKAPGCSICRFPLSSGSVSRIGHIQRYSPDLLGRDHGRLSPNPIQIARVVGWQLLQSCQQALAVHRI